MAWQSRLPNDLSHDAQDVATDVVDPVGRQTFVHELAHIDLFSDPADLQEGRILGGDVLLVRIAQRFELLPDPAVRFEPDENRLMYQKLQQVDTLHTRSAHHIGGPFAIRIPESAGESSLAVAARQILLRPAPGSIPALP